MEVAELNHLILEHLRYYGYSLAARILESEFKTKTPKDQPKSSRLVDIISKSGNTNFGRTNPSEFSTPSRGNGKMAQSEIERRSDGDDMKLSEETDSKRAGLSVRSDPANIERNLISQALNFNLPYNGNEGNKLEYYTGIQKKYGLNSRSTLTNIAKLITNNTSTNTTQYSSAKMPTENESEYLYSKNGPIANGKVTFKESDERNNFEITEEPLNQTHNISGVTGYDGYEYQKSKVNKPSNNRSISTPASGRPIRIEDSSLPKVANNYFANQIGTKQVENYMKINDSSSRADQRHGKTNQRDLMDNSGYDPRSNDNSFLNSSTIEYTREKTHQDSYMTLNPYRPPENNLPQFNKKISRDGNRVVPFKNVPTAIQNKKIVTANEIIQPSTQKFTPKNPDESNLPKIKQTGQAFQKPEKTQQIIEEDDPNAPHNQLKMYFNSQLGSEHETSHLQENPHPTINSDNQHYFYNPLPPSYSKPNENQTVIPKKEKQSMTQNYQQFLLQEDKRPLEQNNHQMNLTKESNKQTEFESHNNALNRGLGNNQSNNPPKYSNYPTPKNVTDMKYQIDEIHRGNQQDRANNIRIKRDKTEENRNINHSNQVYDHSGRTQNQNAIDANASPQLVQYLTSNTSFEENEIKNLYKAYIIVTGSPDQGLNQDSFLRFLREVKGIYSPTFRDYLFISGDNLSLVEKGNVYFKESILIIDQMNPEHPFAIMKFMFKICEADDRICPLSEIEKILIEFSKGNLKNISEILLNSILYIYKKNDNNRQIVLSFEEYMSQVQDFAGLKQFC